MTLDKFLRKSENWHLINAVYQQKIGCHLYYFDTRFRRHTIVLPEDHPYTPSNHISNLVALMLGFFENMKDVGIVRLDYKASRLYATHRQQPLELSSALVDLFRFAFNCGTAIFSPEQILESIHTLEKFDRRTDEFKKFRRGFVVKGPRKDQKIWICPRMGIFRRMFHAKEGTLP